MSIELQQQLRLQQDDLREAVEDLTGWLTDMEKTEAVARKQTLPIQPELPPVRGTCAPESNLAQPSSSVSIPAEDPLLLYKDRGNAFFKAGKYKEAIEQYTRGIGYDPRGKDAHILYGNRSMAYLNLSMLQEAEMDASMSTELNRTYTKGYYRRGMARHRLGKVQEALQDYERVLVLEPTNQEAKQAVQEVRSHLVSVTSQTSENNATQAIRRRKLVVEEVEEEEEEEEVKDSSKLGSAPRVVPLPVTTSSAAKSTPAVTPPDVKLTQSQIDAQRRCEEAFRELEKTKQGNRSIHEPMSSTHHTGRSNPRVQEICDEPHATDPSPCLKNEKVVSKHRDVNENLEEGPQQSMKERGGKVAQTTLPPSPQTDTKSKKTLASRIFELPPLTKAQLSIPPRNILEYDKMLSEITQSCPVKRPDASGATEAEWVKQHQRELFAHYFRNLLPETYATFFRSNLSSITIERVLDALRYDYAINDASYAVRVLKGLLKIPRFDDMLMFCEAQEKETIQWIFDTVMSQVKGEKEEEMVQQLRSSYMELLGGIP